MSMDNLKISIEESVKAAFGDNAKYILQNWEFRQEFDFIIWAEENPSHTKYPISYEQRIEQALEKARWVHEHILTPATAQVGDGVTICYWSDRNAATVIKKTPFSLTVRRTRPPWTRASSRSGFRVVLRHLHQPGRPVLHL